jgi:hypothetical protein
LVRTSESTQAEGFEVRQLAPVIGQLLSGYTASIGGGLASDLLKSSSARPCVAKELKNARFALWKNPGDLTHRQAAIDLGGMCPPLPGRAIT